MQAQSSLSKRYRTVLRRERLHFLFSGSRAFGSGWHRFRANRYCERHELSAFEAKWKVSLPNDYKDVLLNVGNGCPGPYYGLTPLDAWHYPLAEIAQLTDTFLARPFDSTAPSEAGLYSGTLRICNAGCEHYLLLVVSGTHAGEIWHDAGADGLGVFPVLGSTGQRLSFASWIAEWLDAIASGGTIEGFWSSHEFANHALAQELLASHQPPTTIAIDQLPCPSCVHRLNLARPLPRVIVPAVRTSHANLLNPKRAAVLAARGELSVSPRQVLL